MGNLFVIEAYLVQNPVDTWVLDSGATNYICNLLAYMAIDIDFDEYKPHVLIKQRFMNCAFTIRK